jgi:hypothetical protein
MTQSKRGEAFNMIVTLHTDKNCYAVLVDEAGLRYLPVIITEAHLNALEKVLALPQNERNTGLFDLGIASSFCHLLDLLGCETSCVVIEWGEDEKHFDCHMEIYQCNEVDTCLLSLPIPLFEAPLLASITSAMFYLYETPEKRIALALDPALASKDIKEAVVDDILKREKTL